MKRLIPLVLLAAPAVAQDRPVLTVLTYDSFTSEWGPGPEIETRFEETCGCDLVFETGGDGAALLARVQLEGEGSDADLVLGLDTNLMARARETGLFAPHGIEAPALDLPVEWDDDTFLPFDWGWFAFVRRADTPAPASLADLAASDATVIVQDPRSSTPGLGLALWLERAGGPELMEAMADNVVTVTKGWSEAYGLFTEGEADMVLSYTTSPAYHLIAEGDDGFAADAMAEGNYLQVEVAAMLAGSDQPELARAFLAFMDTDAFQSVIPTTNWMYPARTPAEGLPDGFDTLAVPETSLLADPADGEAPARAAAAWLDALARR